MVKIIGTNHGKVEAIVNVLKSKGLISDADIEKANKEIREKFKNERRPKSNK